MALGLVNSSSWFSDPHPDTEPRPTEAAHSLGMARACVCVCVCVCVCGEKGLFVGRHFTVGGCPMHSMAWQLTGIG